MQLKFWRPQFVNLDFRTDFSPIKPERLRFNFILSFFSPPITPQNYLTLSLTTCKPTKSLLQPHPQVKPNTTAKMGNVSLYSPARRRGVGEGKKKADNNPHPREQKQPPSATARTRTPRSPSPSSRSTRRPWISSAISARALSSRLRVHLRMFCPLHPDPPHPTSLSSGRQISRRVN